MVIFMQKKIFFSTEYICDFPICWIKSFSAMQRSHNINNDQRKWIKTGKEKKSIYTSRQN